MANLDQLIVEILKKSDEPIKAREIARLLKMKGLRDIDRKQVNSRLYTMLGQGVAARDDDFCWSLPKSKSKSSSRARPEPDDEEDNEEDYSQNSDEDDEEIDERTQALRTLELPADATAAQIKAKHRDLSLLYHPDRLGHISADTRRICEEQLKKINEAFDLLRQK